MTPTPSASQNASADAGEGLERKLASIIYWRMYPESPRHPGKHFPVEAPQKVARQAAREIIAKGLAALRQTSSEPVAWPENDPRYEIDVDYEIWQGCDLQASASDLNEARRYAALYEPCSLVMATTYRQPVDAPLAAPEHAAPEHAASERVRVLEEAVALAASTFERYAALHYQKHTSDGDEKARANAELAVQMRAALNPQSQEKGQ